MVEPVSKDTIPFNRPHMAGGEMAYMEQAGELRKFAGGGSFTSRSQSWLEQETGCHRALLTHSCTAALEMAALLLDLKPGDEVIMPSFTFVSTASAFALRGAVPVFVDIRSDTLNLDERLIEDAVTPATKAIIPVHYAGVACEMDEILKIAARRGLKVVEDAAQGLMASYNGRPLGAIGDLGALSFHETKNIISGEGGALLVNDERLAERAEIIREKGTDRSRFLRGDVDKYTWQELGSSFLPSEITAAFLLAQLEKADAVTANRMASWNEYHRLLQRSEADGLLRRPITPQSCRHNAHMYYVLLHPAIDRQRVIDELRREGMQLVFHYAPLHSSPAGMRHGRACGSMQVTEDASSRLVRLPLWFGMSSEQLQRVTDALEAALRR
jgi:dTDP-4-amino-4,6-dideoxygalactose transaminase